MSDCETRLKEYIKTILKLQNELDVERNKNTLLTLSLMNVRKIMSKILVKQELNGVYKPVKNTSKEDCYKALYDIQELLWTNRIE